MSMLQINALARRIASADPDDHEEQAQILGRLREVRNALKRASDTQTQGYLDASILLLNYVVEMGHIGGREIVSVVSRLLASMQADFAARAAAGNHKELPREEEPPALKASPTAARQPGSLQMRLIGDLLLGEVMIKLRYVGPEQVEQALRVQRATSVRFGEALVQTGAATWDQIKLALRYQEENRGNSVLSINTGVGFAAASERKDAPITSRELGYSDNLKVLSDVLLGEILVQNGLVTLEQLRLALTRQRANDMLIGEALIDIGAATPHDIEYALRLQKRMHKREDS